MTHVSSLTFNTFPRRKVIKKIVQMEATKQFKNMTELLLKVPRKCDS